MFGFVRFLCKYNKREERHHYQIKRYLHHGLMVGHPMLFLFASHLPIAMPLMAILLYLCYGLLYHLDLKSCICQWEAIFQKILPKVTIAVINIISNNNILLSVYCIYVEQFIVIQLQNTFLDIYLIFISFFFNPNWYI